MATNNVSTFLQTIGQGVKPNMFLVDIVFPDSISLQTEDKQLTDILCKSAALPGSNLGVIEVPFRGRTVKIAGDRTFDTWSATFFNDKDFKLRSFFEQWANSINTHEGNTAPLFTPSSTTGYMASLAVHQLEKDASVGGSKLRTYKLVHCFPTNVSPIDLAYDSNDQIEEFTVEWQYSFFTAEGGDRPGVSAVPVV
tara:strand:+ start:1211 stop:1798 length:588 start_codon:yes stop_codon:yes gene_type:complete